MPAWITIPSFTSGQIVRAETFQDLYQNLDTLKNPESAAIQQAQAASPGDDWALVTTSTWTDVDATYWEMNLETYGGDLFISADIVTEHSAANGVGYWRFVLDGVALGNDSGLLGGRDNTGQEAYHLHTIVEGLAAGSHTITMQWYNGTTGTLYMEKYASQFFWTYEFP